MHRAITRILDRWCLEDDAKPAIRPGASPEALTRFEAKYGIILPPEMRELYATFNGMDEMDDSWLRIHPIEEVVSVCDFDPSWPSGPSWTKHWFLFADYLIDSHAYLVRLSATPGDPGPVVSWGYGEEDKRMVIAHSFAGFLEGYALDKPEQSNALLGTDEVFPDDPKDFSP